VLAELRVGDRALVPDGTGDGRGDGDGQRRGDDRAQRHALAEPRSAPGRTGCLILRHGHDVQALLQAEDRLTIPTP
jgi:hypothetical protein